LGWLNFFNEILYNWLPWLNFFNEVFFIQFFIYYVIYLIFFTNNLYFSLFYLFFQFFLLGLYISFYNLELFTAFLWLTECVIIFITILFLFYLNVFGDSIKINFILFSFKYFGIFLSFFLITSIFINPFELEFFLSYNFKIDLLTDDYYDSLFNTKLNDLFSLYMSYYSFNSFEFLIIGVLLLVASLVCVNLNKFNSNLKLNSYYDFFVIFDFFEDFLNFSFLRKQNLVDQTIQKSSIRFFRKKSK
jgi:hypothetical protein